MSPLSPDAVLINRILAGERALFHDLIRPIERSVYLLLYSLLRNETEAEDAAQETAIKVYQNLRSFRGEAKFKTWVLTIARNEGLGRLRKAKRANEESIDGDVDEAGEEIQPLILADWREVPSEALERKEVREMIWKAIEGLPEIYRNVLMLRDIEELDCRETAMTLGISEGATKVRLHRARLMLEKELAPQLKDYAPRPRGFFGWGR